MPANPRKQIVYNFKTFGYFLRPGALSFLEEYLQKKNSEELKAQIYLIIDGINSIKQSDSSFSSDMFITEAILKNALTFISQGADNNQDGEKMDTEHPTTTQEYQNSDIKELAHKTKQKE